MARKVLLEGTGYALVPTTRTFTIPKYLPQERLILITNLTSNKVVYNFSDPSLGYTTYTPYIDPVTGNESTTIVLKYDTTSMGANDEFQILVDEDAQLITPSQTYMDPTNKMRVTQPQALIDTDFEYGTQYSKWEAVGTIDQRPYFYQSPTVVPNVTDITINTGFKTTTVTTSIPHGLVLGQPIVVIDTYYGPSNGNFVIETIPSLTTFTYTAKAVNTSVVTTSILDPNKSAIYLGSLFTQSSIGGAPQSIAYDATTGKVTVTTSQPHGLSLGNEIAMVGSSGITVGTSGLTTTTANVNGNFVVSQIIDATSFAYYTNVNMSGSSATGNAGPTGVAAAPFNSVTSIGNNSSSVGSNLLLLAGNYTTGDQSKIAIGSVLIGTNIPSQTTVNAITQAALPQISISGSTGVAGTSSTYTTANTAGLYVGAYVTVSGSSNTTHNGTFLITTVNANTSFVVDNKAATVTAGTGTIVYTGYRTYITLSSVINNSLSSTSVNFYASVYMRPQAQFMHRPFDGGVLFSGNSLSNNTSATRQTRRYFRYQSGKGIQISSGTVLKPYSNVDQITVNSLSGSTASITAISGSGSQVTYSTGNTNGITAGQYITVTGASYAPFNGTFLVTGVTSNSSFTTTSTAQGVSSSAVWTVYPLVTIQTKEKHNIIPGVTITVAGSTDPGYNVTNATVTSVLAWNKFTYVASGIVSNYAAPGYPVAAVTGWSGAASRLGLFDNQNGIFFEYDGSTLYAVRRSSVFQIAGKVSAIKNSSLITQTDATYTTLFSKQMSPGDTIVLRGIAYRVTDILNDSQLLISPSYRGEDSKFITASKVIDTRIPQSQWNIDRMDGTGPSGYNTDLTKMQMYYMDYTWYGAGFVRWGLRGVKGDVTYGHKMPNNNVNTEAYMRSGNLPARYEIVNNPPTTVLTAGVGATIGSLTTDTISVSDTTKFPSSGTLGIRQVTVNNYAGTISGTTSSGTDVTYTLASTSISITSCSANNTSATYTTANTQGLYVGASITISGASVGGFNVVQTITSITNNVNFTTSLSGLTNTATTATGTIAASTTGLALGAPVIITGSSIPGHNGSFLVTNIVTNTSFKVANTTTGTGTTAYWAATTYGKTIEFVNYASKPSSTTFSGITRAKAGTTGVAGAGVTFTAAINTSVGSVSSSDALLIQPGMRVLGATSTYINSVPENTFVVAVAGTQITLSQAVTTANPSLYFIPMSSTTAQTFTYSATNPITVELAYPSFSPLISHWGTSVIMDGRYDDDKSLLFTYGQTQQTPLGNASGYYTITAITGDGTTATYSTSNTSGLTVGQTISVVGSTNTGFNVTSTAITAVNPNVSFSLLNATSATVTAQSAVATFGTPTTTQFASVASSSTITFPNLNTVVQGQIITGPTGITNGSSITGVQTSQPIQISAITPVSSLSIPTAGIASIVGNGTSVTVTLSGTAPYNTNNLRVGVPVTISGTTGGTGTFNGTFPIATIASATAFTYLASGNSTATTTAATVQAGVTAITAITGNGTTATYTTANTSNIFVGQPITISGATTAGYNGTYVVNSVTANTSFTVLNATTGTTSTATGITNYLAFDVPTTSTPPAAFQYVTITGANSVNYNNTFYTISANPVSASGTTSFIVPTFGLLAGGSSSAAGVVYSATLDQTPTATQTGSLNLYGASTKALFSIRIAPSVDNGIPARLGQREIVNRMQLILRALDLSTASYTGNIAPTNILVTAVLNGIPNLTTSWTNVTKNQIGVANSSLAMIADYAGTNTVLSGGEVTGGFFTNSTTSIDLSNVRDLGNSILGGGGTTSNTNIYPDGPDTLTIVAQNLSSVPVQVSGRLSWSEAQA